MNQPWNEINASSIAGVVLDCDLSTGTKIGGGTATDNTAALNAVLATASATNPIKLILDGPSLVTGLVISSNGYTTIEGIGWASGIWIKSGSNADPIQNGIPYNFAGFFPTSAPPAQTGPVILRNFKINGNRGNGTTGNVNTGAPQGISGFYWYCNITLYGVKGLRIEDMYIYDASAYAIRLLNCSDVKITGNYIWNPNITTTVNNDGIHIDAPCTDILISGNYINNNNSDDAVALNAYEGYPNTYIDRAVITGNTFQNTLTALRVYGHIEAQVGSVVFANNVGSVNRAVLLIGVDDGAAPATGDIAVRSLIASGNIFTTSNKWVSLQAGVGDITLTDCKWLSPTSVNSFIQGDIAGTTSSITVNNCSIYRNTSGTSASTTLLASTVALTVKKLIINGFYVINEQGQSYAAIANLLAMTNITIAQLYIAALDYTNITALADSYTNIASISGVWQPESNIQSKTAAYTLLPTDRTVLASTTAGSFAVALPAKSYAGEKHTIKNTGTANTLTVTGTVDGAANPTLTTLAKMTVEYDGTSWWTV